MLIPLLFGCAASSVIPDDCDPAPRLEGEVRARRIVCSDEIQEDGETRVGDWMLENSHLRIAIRDATHSLTQLQGTGGTILDVAVGNGADTITEIIPQLDGQWFGEAILTAENGEGSAEIAVTGTDHAGNSSAVRYRMTADTPAVEISGHEDLLIVPNVGAVVFGRFLESTAEGTTTLLGSDGGLDDLGGWVRWHGGRSVWAGTRDAVHKQAWPSAEAIEGSSDGDWVHIKDGDEVVGRLPVLDGHFAGLVPRGAQVQAVSAGALASDWVAATDGLDLEVGASARLDLQIIDQAGEFLPAVLQFGGQEVALSDPLSRVPMAPNGYDISISAGPAYSTHEETIVIADVTSRLITLDRVVPEAVLMTHHVPAFPDPTERRRTVEIEALLHGHGFGFAVLNAVNEVAQKDRDGADEKVLLQPGSRSGIGEFDLITWPWTGKLNEPAHGAAPDHLDLLDRIAFMTKRGRRDSIVDVNLTARIADPTRWDPPPDLVFLSLLPSERDDQIALYAALLDQWLHPGAVGPMTWIEAEEDSESGVVQALLRGGTIATTGPHIELRVDGQGPGADLTEFPPVPFREFTVDLSVSAPARMALDHVVLVGSGMQLLAEFDFTDTAGPVRLQISRQLQTTSPWILAVATGPEHSALTSPVWLDRP